MQIVKSSPFMFPIRPYECGMSMLKRLEQLVSSARITDPAYPDVHYVYVMQALRWSVDYPSDPWAKGAEDRFRAGVWREARKLGIRVYPVTR